jgi:hypothetical protein
MQLDNPNFSRKVHEALGRPGPIEAFGELTGVTAPATDDGAAVEQRGGSILMLEPAAALRSA